MCKCQKKPKPKQQRRREPEALGEQEVRKGTRRGWASSGMRMRHSKAMRAPRRYVRREVGIGIRLPADHDEVAGEVAEQDVRCRSGPACVLYSTSHTEAHVPVRGSVKRVPCGLNVRLPDTHVAAAVYSRP